MGGAKTWRGFIDTEGNARTLRDVMRLGGMECHVGYNATEKWGYRHGGCHHRTVAPIPAVQRHMGVTTWGVEQPHMERAKTRRGAATRGFTTHGRT